MKTYTLTEDLVQAIVNLLGEMPAKHSRNVLNGLEAQCKVQEQQPEVKVVE